MRTHYPLLAWIAGALGVLWAWSVLPAAPPLELGSNDPNAATKIEDSLRAWVKEFVASGEEAKVLKLRDRLLTDHQYAVARGHGYAYALRVVKDVSPLLSGVLKADDPLRQAKRINVAVIFSRIKQVPVQDALDRMVAHDNPAIRLLGWHGYRGLRVMLLSQGMGHTKQMFAAMRQAAQQERSPVVIAKLLQAATLPPARPGAMEAPVWEFAQQESMRAVEIVWARLCRRVRAGDRLASDAARSGTAMLQALNQAAPENTEQTKSIIQMLADMTYCASKAYYEWFDHKIVVVGQITVAPNVMLSGGEGAKVKLPGSCRTEQVAPGRYSFVVAARQLAELRKAIGPHGTLKVTERREGPNEVVEANGLLLRECEKALNAITKQNKSVITDPLKARRIRARNAAVRSGALDWEEALEKLYKIRRPEDSQFMQPRPAPAAPPAPAAATKT